MASMRLSMCLLIILTLSLCASLSFASEKNFFERKAEGWFWYKDPPEPKEPEKKLEPKPVPPPAPKNEPTPAPAPIEPAPFSAEWITANQPKYLSRALDEPTPENVAAYYYLQRVMMDKSQRFADASQAVVFGDPFLDESVRRPIATFGAAQSSRESHAETNALLSKLGQDIGIWFFFQSNCSYCEKQVDVQEMLEKAYGIKTYAISLDGKPLASGKYPNYVVDQGQSRQLDVVQTPAMFLAKPSTGELAPLGQGMLALDELKKRILIASSSAGWISEKMFDKTRPARGPLLDSAPLQNYQDNQQDPNKIIEVLRQQLTGGKNGR